MESAPNGAVFIWCNGHTNYPKMLARKIGRDDLRIEAPSWLEDRWIGLELTGLIVDHAARLSARQWDGLQGARTRVRLPAGG
jgi:hypothetical protein